MATQDDPPLDEIQWRSPELVQDLGGIFTNTVLPYFQASPFFDATSNNGLVTKMAMSNLNMYHIIQTRAAFEEYLSDMTGIEYRVAHDPSESDRIPWNQHSGVWIIKKQRRERVQEADGRTTMGIEPLSTYYVVNENVYMAPTIGSVLGSKLLSASNALASLYKSASSIPIYNPALGRVYTLPSAKPKVGTSAVNTRQNSKEPSPLPEAQVSSFIQSAEEEDEPIDQHSAALFKETFGNNQLYARRYMDEQPLIGEPGSFIVQKSKDLQVPVGKEGSEKRTTAPAPPPLKTDLKTEVGKKIKGQNSPTTAGGEKSPLSPTGAAKKRKKSKVQTPRTPKTPR